MNWLLAIPALFSGACFAQEPSLQPRPVPPHLHEASTRFFVSSGANAMASMDILVHRSSTDRQMDVEVSWKDMPTREIQPQDWIGLFETSIMTQFHAPVKYRYVFPYGAKKTDLVDHGSMNFTVPNFRASYVLVYISGSIQFPQILAQANVPNFSSTSMPMAAHIALSPTDPTKMLVMWNQKSPKAPMLKWGLSPDGLVNTVPATSDTYTREDFCDTATSPASRQGWFEPGLLLTAEMPIRPATTYYYNVGDATDGWYANAINFTTPPASDAASTRIIILADMGNAPLDGSMQHSWDFGNRGEIPSRNTSRLTKHLLDKTHAHAVVHIGDISYAVGYLSEWDEFMQQIEPVASRIPWMASIGNHEMGWSQSDVFNGTLATQTDSGGECGVPFLKRFPYAMQTLSADKAARQADAWYSFEVGPVHFTMLSSEHDFASGSPQWQWMIKDLESVNRTLTPWLVVTAHRPMYVASSWSGDQAVMKLLGDNLEAELVKYGVDFFFAGHHHSYQRWCKLNAGKCVDEAKGEHGVYHFVVGMAGYDHSAVSPEPRALVTDKEHWGVTYWDFNETTASMQYIDGATEEVIDSFTYHKSGSKQELDHLSFVV